MGVLPIMFLKWTDLTQIVASEGEQKIHFSFLLYTLLFPVEQ